MCSMLNKYCQFCIIFQLLGRLYQRCDAKTCICPKGREHHLNGTKFEIVRCEVLIFLHVILNAEIFEVNQNTQFCSSSYLHFFSPVAAEVFTYIVETCSNDLLYTYVKSIQTMKGKC